MERKLITYVTLHYLNVHKWFISMNDQWTAGNYYETGHEFALDVHTMLGTRLTRLFEDIEQLPQLTDR